MDIFDVLKAISKRKVELVRVGMNECEALKNAELSTSKEYHIPPTTAKCCLCDIKRLCGVINSKVLS